MSKTRPLEKELEAKLIRRVQEELGGVSLKTHVRHWPDHVFFLPEGRCFFVEVKKEGGNLSDGQRVALRDLALLGHHVYTVWCEYDIVKIIEDQRD